VDSIELSAIQHEQMALLVGQLNTTRTVAEAFVGYFAKELGVNLQLYQFNADTFRFEPVGGMGAFAQPVPQEQVTENGKIEAI
jgi:hypothetical protein